MTERSEQSVDTRDRQTPSTLAVIRSAARGLHKSQLPRMAAALAYRTLFGLIPVLVIGLVFLGSFASEEQVTGAIERILDYSGISEIVIEEAAEIDAASPMPDEFGSGPGIAASALTELSLSNQSSAQGRTGGSVPEGPPLPLGGEDGAQRMGDWVSGLVMRVQTIPFRTIGFIGALILVYAAISMLVEVERAFNQIYHAPAGRSWIGRIPRYWTLLTLGTVFLIATFYVGEAFTSWMADFAGLQDDTGWALRTLGFTVTVLISTALLFVIYTTVPNTRVKLRPALAGAFVAAILWETGKWAFTMYVGYSASYARLYGSIAIIPLFLLWVYVTWIIVLFGLQIAYALQSFKSWIRDQAERDDTARFIEPTSVIEVMLAIGLRFQKGKPAEADELAREAGLDEVVVSRMLSRLCEAEFLHRVNADQDEDMFTLARPPQEIRADELLSIADELSGRQNGGGPCFAAVEPLRRALHKAAEGQTLDALLNRAPAKASKAPTADTDSDSDTHESTPGVSPAPGL